MGQVVGIVEVWAVFKFGERKVVGCYVREGKIQRSSKVRVVRDGTIISPLIELASLMIRHTEMTI